MTEFDDRVGEEIGVGDWMEITQERVDAFADATDDHQWIHMAGKAADEGPFGGPIAHGYLTLSLVSTLTSEVMEELRGDAKMLINYGLDRVRFISPVPVGSQIRTRVRLLEAKAVEGGTQLKSEVTIEIDGKDKPAAVAETLTRVYN